MMNHHFVVDNVSDESKEEESGEDDCEYSCTEQNGCAVEYTGPVEGTTVTLVRVIIFTTCICICNCETQPPASIG